MVSSLGSPVTGVLGALDSLLRCQLTSPMEPGLSPGSLTHLLTPRVVQEREAALGVRPSSMPRLGSQGHLLNKTPMRCPCSLPSLLQVTFWTISNPVSPLD